MNKIAQKTADILGSSWVIGGFGLWLIAHNLMSRDYVTFISDTAIFITLLILRAEKIEGERMETYIKDTRRASEKDLELSKQILDRLKYER